MHILIIPSEEFMPAHNKLDGIFQYHQASILKQAGYKIGVLSVRLEFSVPMILKGLFFKLLGRKTGNATDLYKKSQLLKLGAGKFFLPKRSVAVEKEAGLTIYRMNGLFFKPPVNNKNHISWVKAGMVCFKEYSKQEGRPDVIHAHNAIYAGMLADKIHEEFGLPYVLTEHSSTYALKAADAETLKLVKKSYDKASGLFAVSESFASLLNRLFSFERFRYLPNVLDQQLENYHYKPSGNGHHKFTFLHIAGLLAVKDQQTLLKAFKLVADQNPNAELRIGGVGELLDQLKIEIAELGIQNSVKFLGLLDREGVIDELGRCDCFVLSSRYETFGVVLIEAMLFGKPVISTSVGVAPTIITDKVGYVVSPGDAEGLALAMKQMLATHKSYDPGYIRDFAIRNFGRESFLHKMNKIYSEVE
jgi:glycosyltransferase involved in cell wall biosynthesis